MSPLLLDTCAVIYISLSEPIRRAVRDELTAVTETGSGANVSTISALEIGMLAARGRLGISQRAEDWFNAFLSRPGVALAPLSPSLLIASSYLPGKHLRDPWDRIIAATAREYGYRVVTRDRALLSYADAGHINAIEC